MPEIGQPQEQAGTRIWALEDHATFPFLGSTSRIRTGELDMIATDTAELVRAAKEGNREAQGALLVRYELHVRRAVSLNLGKSLAAFVEHDDLVQDSMLEALKRLSRFDYKGEGALIAWLVDVAEKQIQNFARRLSRQKRERSRERLFGQAGSALLTASFFASPGASPSQCAEANEFEALLEVALLDLSERSRRVVVLRQMLGLSHAEIAARLEMTEVAVRTVFARALAKIGAGLPLGVIQIQA